MSYGTTISNFRREVLKLNQSELADKIGISQNNLCMVERGYRLPSLKMIEKISKYSGHHVSEILGYEYNKKNTK